MKKYERCNPHLEDVNAWIPIDINLILPMHEAYGRMPGLFYAAQVFYLEGGESETLKILGKDKATLITVFIPIFI